MKCSSIKRQSAKSLPMRELAPRASGSTAPAFRGSKPSPNMPTLQERDALSRTRRRSRRRISPSGGDASWRSSSSARRGSRRTKRSRCLQRSRASRCAIPRPRSSLRATRRTTSTAGRRFPESGFEVTNRNAMQPSRVGASLLWAINKTSGGGLKLDNHAFDLRFGSPRRAEALMRGEDPDCASSTVSTGRRLRSGSRHDVPAVQ